MLILGQTLDAYPLQKLKCPKDTNIMRRREYAASTKLQDLKSRREGPAMYRLKNYRHQPFIFIYRAFRFARYRAAETFIVYFFAVRLQILYKQRLDSCQHQERCSVRKKWQNKVLHRYRCSICFSSSFWQIDGCNPSQRVELTSDTR